LRLIENEIQVDQNWEEQWTLTQFPDLLTDAIFFYIQANSSPEAPFDIRNRNARYAVLAAAMAIECAANCCLWRMHHKTPKELSILDRLAVLDKYDTLLREQKKAKLTKGIKVVQCADELLDLRNRFAHPKLLKKKRKMSWVSPGVRQYEEIDEKTTPILHMPLDLNSWLGEHSRKAVIAAIRFLNHFFADLCKITPAQCADFLSVRAVGDNTQSTGPDDRYYFGVMEVPEQSELLRQAEAIYGLRIQFLIVSEEDQS
jgi:hypothetical protein